MAIFGFLAVLQNLFLLRLGFEARFIGLMLGVGQLVWATAALPAGLLSNRLGLRNGLLLGRGLAGLGLALMLLVEDQPASLWRPWLMASQGVVMLGAAFITVNIPPYLMAVTGEQERRYAFALFQAIIPATAFVGSLLTGLLPGLFAGWLDLTLDQAAPYRLALWTGPLLLFLSILPLLGADPARVAVQGRSQTAHEPAPLKWLLFFGSVIGEGAVRAFFNVYLDTALAVPTAQIGTIMGLAQLLPIAAALSAPWLIARLGTGYALATVTLGISLCLLPLAAGPQVGIAALAFMGVIAMSTVAGTTRDLFGQEMVTPGWRTTSQGVAIIGLALGWATVGLVGGYLIETIGFGALFLIGAISALVSAGLLVGFLRRRQALTLPEPERVVG
jgi:MFS family permease